MFKTALNHLNIVILLFVLNYSFFAVSLFLSQGKQFLLIALNVELS